MFFLEEKKEKPFEYMFFNEAILLLFLYFIFLTRTNRLQAQRIAMPLYALNAKTRKKMYVCMCIRAAQSGERARVV